MFPLVFKFLLFKTCVQSSIGTPNNYSFICQPSITTLKEYVGSPMFQSPFARARSCALPIAPGHQETHPAFHFQITNEVVIWDRIVRSKENAIIHIDNASNKYAFREISKSFRCAEYFNLSPTFLEIGSLVAQSWWTRALVIIQIRVLAQSLS